MASFIALFYLTLFTTLRVTSYLAPVPLHRDIILFQHYIIWWILLVYACVVKDGATFPITLLHAGAWLALVLGLVETLLLEKRKDVKGLRVQGGVGNEDGVAGEIINDAEVETEIVIEREQPSNTDADEQTPLLHTYRKPIGFKSDLYEEKDSVGGLWILQYLVLIGFPVLFASQMALSGMGMLGQTLSDGNSSSLRGSFHS